MSDQAEELRAAVRARYPGPNGDSGAPSSDYWAWWIRWQRASDTERTAMEQELTS